MATPTPAVASGARSDGTASATLFYVYTILPAASPAAAALRERRLAGIGGAAVGAVEAGGLVAAVSKVPAAEFEEAPLNRLLSNMDWLGERAATHQAVNAQLFGLTAALLPLSFGTVYRAAESVRQLLAGHADDLNARLAAVRGRAEWVLTLRKDVAAQRAAVERDSPTLAALGREIAAAAPGRAYLLRRRTADLLRQEIEAADLRAAAALQAMAASVADRVYAERVAGDAELAQGGAATVGRAVARLTVLLPRDRRDAPPTERWGAFGAEWRAGGYTLDVTGAWPPYRSAGAAPPEPAPAAPAEDRSGPR